MFPAIAIVYIVIKGAFFAGLVKAFSLSPSIRKAIVFGILWTAGVAALSTVYFNPDMLEAMGLSWDTRRTWLAWNLGLSTLYFTLLAWFEDSGSFWWVIRVAGVGLVIL